MREIIKEFREKFDELGKFLATKYGTHIHYLPLRRLTESFWLSKLEVRNQDLLKKIEEMKIKNIWNERYKQGYKQAKEDIKKLI